MRRHGILQPLLVAPAGEAEALAVIENLQREDLNPIDEARGFYQAMKARQLNHAQLAEELSIPAGRISERLGLLRLPEGVQRRIAAGEVSPTLRKTLAAIAKVSAQVAEGCAAVVAAGCVEASALEADPARVVSSLGRFEWRDDDGEPKAAPAALEVNEWLPVRLEQLPVAEDVLEELCPRVEALGTDAARAYGCLLEFRGGDRFRTAKFLCDREFIADRARLKLDELERRAAEAEERAAQERRERAERAREEAAAAGVEVDEDTDPEIALREQRRRERQAERQEAVAARGANLELGRKLYTDAHAPELTMDCARLLALLVFEGDAGALAARGLALCRDDWHEVEVRELKSGQRREKVTYPSLTEAEELLWAWFERARTPQEVLGRVVQALLAAGCADETCRPQSQRTRYVLPGTYGAGPGAEIGELMDRLADPYLPPRLSEQARERAERRARYSEDRADLDGVEAGDVDHISDEVENEGAAAKARPRPASRAGRGSRRARPVRGSRRLARAPARAGPIEPRVARRRRAWDSSTGAIFLSSSRLSALRRFVPRTAGRF